MYTPYSSDTDSEDSDLDPRYALIRAAGPNMDTSAIQLKYMQHLPGAEYTPLNPSLSSLTYLNPPKTVATSLYSMKSSNRDKSVYPSPYNFQIKLPKVYKNVVRIQLLQLSFPYNVTGVVNTSLASTFSTFIDSYNFDPLCISSCLNIFTNSATKSNAFGVVEQGRMVDGAQMLSKIAIPQKSYNNLEIAAQLTRESNNTPPLNIITYDNFKNAFKITKDIKMLFNEPGDNYSSKLLNAEYTNHTKDIIMNTYYTQYDVDKHPVITDTIAFNAYYYPILKELVATEFGSHFIRTDLSKDELIYNVLSTFLGLDSIIYYDICFNNSGVLDEYRKNLTFQNRNINRYIWGYDNNRFNCKYDTLHTSIRNDISNSLTKITADELNHNSFNINTFNALKTNNMNNSVILDHLQSNLSTIYTSYFMEEYSKEYSKEYSRTFSELHEDPLFTNMFQFTNIFGNQYGTYSGKRFTFTNFLDYHSTISSYKNIVESTNNTISTIYGNINDKHHTYISSKYSDVFSNDMIQNRTYKSLKSLPAAFTSDTLIVPGYQNLYMDSCVSTCYNAINSALNNYYSNIPVNTVINTLDYKLGMINGVNFNNTATFFNTVLNYNYDFFLQINSEQSFNNIDVAMPENYNITNETTGQTKLMFAKILTAGVGSRELSQTCIQNPIVIPNSVGKLDKLIFKIYLNDNSITPMWLFYPFVEQRDEWSATFQIDEEIGFADRNAGFGTNPTIDIPNNPNSFSFLGLTAKK